VEVLRSDPSHHFRISRYGPLEQSLTAAERLLRPEGLAYRRLSCAETIELEPALEPIVSELAGTIHYSDDETGDAHRFCIELAEHARSLGVSFAFDTIVTALETASGLISAVRIRTAPAQATASTSSIQADQYVVAGGSYSAPLLRPLGVRLPVRPAKGYSVTFDAPRSARSLKTPIVDDDMHAAVVPVGNAIRVAGTAEFAGFDLALRPERIRNLVNLARRILPRAGLDPTTARPWCGLRPMCADGVPIIGRTSIANLWVSTGHGHLGWTMTAGSAALLTDLMTDTAPAIDPAPYDPRRFR
jgi:D-amino-acid dehydrogenase